MNTVRPVPPGIDVGAWEEFLADLDRLGEVARLDPATFSAEMHELRVQALGHDPEVAYRGDRTQTRNGRVARPEVDFGRGAAAFSDHRFSNHRGFVLLGRGGSLPARLLATDDSGPHLERRPSLAVS